MVRKNPTFATVRDSSGKLTHVRGNYTTSDEMDDVKAQVLAAYGPREKFDYQTERYSDS